MLSCVVIGSGNIGTDLMRKLLRSAVAGWSAARSPGPVVGTWLAGVPVFGG